MEYEIRVFLSFNLKNCLNQEILVTAESNSTWIHKTDEELIILAM